MTNHAVLSYKFHRKGNIFLYEEKCITYENNMLYSCHIATLHRIIYRVVERKGLEMLRFASRHDSYNIVNHEDVSYPKDICKCTSLTEMLTDTFSVPTVDGKPPLDRNVKNRLFIIYNRYVSSLRNQIS